MTATAAPGLVADAPRSLVRIAWASFFLIGWCGVLVPSLVRQIELRFGVDDAAVGIWYLVNSGTYAAASFSGGLLTERFGRRAVLPSAAAVFGAGLLLSAAAPAWIVFVLAAVPMGAGAGAIDGGMNALVLAVADARRGRAINLLHVFVGVGALSAPAVIGQLVDRGFPWQWVLALTGASCVAVAVALRLTGMPSGQRRPSSAGAAPAAAPPHGVAPKGGATASQDGIAGSATRMWSSVPLLLLAIAIGCYVAGELGVSNWIVRFLDDVPVTVATLGLSGFWAGLAVGRLVAAFVSDRFSHRAFATAAAIATGLATLLAVSAPTPELAIVAFALAGVASGPVFPMIMAIGGELYPDRLAATAGSLTGAAVVGATVYPPLIGLMSASFGIGTGLIGAALLSLVGGVAILAAARRTAAPDAGAGAAG